MTKFNSDALTEFGPIAGDFNQDGHVTSADIQSMKGALAHKMAYETTHNNMSDADFIILADVNHDGVVSNADLQSLINLLKSGGGSAESVSEPATVTLLACGAGVLLLCRTYTGKDDQSTYNRHYTASPHPNTWNIGQVGVLMRSASSVRRDGREGEEDVLVF